MWWSGAGAAQKFALSKGKSWLPDWTICYHAMMISIAVSHFITRVSPTDCCICQDPKMNTIKWSSCKINFYKLVYKLLPEVCQVEPFIPIPSSWDEAIQHVLYFICLFLVSVWQVPLHWYLQCINRHDRYSVEIVFKLYTLNIHLKASF